MVNQQKLLDKATRNPKGLRFDEFETLLRQCGWTFDRQRGSHRIWYSPNGVRLSLQAKNNRAKGYQVEFKPRDKTRTTYWVAVGAGANREMRSQFTSTFPAYPLSESPCR